MRIRKKPLGDRNLVGAHVYNIRIKKGIKQKDLLSQLQLRGIDMNASSLSKLEGQSRCVSDKEVAALSDILNVPVSKLLITPCQERGITL